MALPLSRAGAGDLPRRLRRLLPAWLALWGLVCTPCSGLLLLAGLGLGKGWMRWMC
jgi:hypothetical protein